MSWQARVDPPWSLSSWRALARHGWCAGIAPEGIDWDVQAQAGLLGTRALPDAAVVRDAPAVPSRFLALAECVVCHRDAARHALLYRVLWRIASGEPGLLERAVDRDVHALQRMAQDVRRDTHKMKAFVRFRAIPGADDAFAAWFEPGHLIVDRVAPFFVRRFTGMRWSIVTPDRSACWDGEALWLGPGGQRDDVPPEDAGEALWRTYYANIFNPARLNLRMMRQEMPQKYWHLLPETHALPVLLRTAGERVQAMAEREAQPVRRRIPGRPPQR